MNQWVVGRRYHMSFFIGAVFAGMICGLLLVGWRFVMLHELWLVVAAGLFGITLWRQTIGMAILAFVAGIICGIYRGGAELYTAASLKTLTGKMIELEGAVSDDPEVDKKGMMVLRLSSIMVKDRSFVGKVWVSMQKNDSIKRSDRVIIKGRAGEGFGAFSLTVYRAELRKAVRSEPGDVALQVRDWFAGTVRRYIVSPEVDLGLGFLLGQKRALSNELMQMLQIAGLTHIVVASGYNLTILVRFARKLFAPLSKYLAFLSGISLVLGFIAITGMSPSMARAGLVAGLSLLAWYYGRKFHPVMLLVMSAAITAMIQPSFLWGDVGWYLSFAAFAGVMILAPLLRAYFIGKDESHWSVRVVIETVAAQIVTLPIIVLLFGSFSLLSLLANVLILPLVPLAMLLVFLTGCFSFVPMIASIVGWCAQAVIAYIVSIAAFVANQDWAIFEGSLSPLMLGAIYCAIIAWIVYALKVTQYRLCDSNIVD